MSELSCMWTAEFTLRHQLFEITGLEVQMKIGCVRSIILCCKRKFGISVFKISGGEYLNAASYI